MIVDFKHLQKAKKNYFSHGIRVLKISFFMIILSIAGILHAIFPFVFLKTVSNGVKKLYKETQDF
tara:strand:- start:853 stop:1047 length:195 start_codon:yes stop_codon:yes gene_type:complete